MRDLLPPPMRWLYRLLPRGDWIWHDRDTAIVRRDEDGDARRLTGVTRVAVKARCEWRLLLPFAR